MAFTGPGRGPHLILTREFELHLRRNGPAFPTADSLTDWARQSRTRPGRATGRGSWRATLCGHETTGRLPLASFVARHLQLTETLARGLAETGTGALWEKEAGEEALQAVTELQAEAEAGGILTPADYAALFHGVLPAP